MTNSSWFLFHREVVEIKRYLEKKNIVPLHFINKQNSFRIRITMAITITFIFG